MSITSTIMQLGRPVAYYPNVARAFGGDVVTAIYLCQFLYWRGRSKGREIYKTREQIEQETALSPYQQRRAEAALKKLGALVVKKKGLPARNYYRFDWHLIDVFLEKELAELPENMPKKEAELSSEEPSQLDVQKLHDSSLRNCTTTSETTTETTKEKNFAKKEIRRKLTFKQQNELDRILRLAEIAPKRGRRELDQWRARQGMLDALSRGEDVSIPQPVEGPIFDDDGQEIPF